MGHTALQVRYSPRTTPGHWSLLGNLYDSPDQQRVIKEALSAFARITRSKQTRRKEGTLSTLKFTIWSPCSRKQAS